ncbi:MAG: DNA methyltransferase [Candidatus Pacebacteria bacterium]|nr:DNA methyltransferase [Candidatus Paceibacterota bacterium]
MKTRTNPIGKIHNADARDLDRVMKGHRVDVTITSPPYFDLKDYGHKKQIGFGQKYPAYLADLKDVFKKTHDITKDTGTLWVIIDTFRRKGEIYTLPFDFARELKGTGWILQEIIIWRKERTVPWSKKGQMRGLIEYILVFKKSENFKYRIDRIRDYSDLKQWWVKYPERYNPKGKTPTEIWSFDIPTQGSWGNGYVDHFCPLPEGLVKQIIDLTTDEGDVVFDPFAGSGTVPAQAVFTKRKYAGFELNARYIKMFKKHIKKNTKRRLKEYANSKINSKQVNFQKQILNLRALKFADVLKKNLDKIFPEYITNVYVRDKNKKPSVLNKLITIEYTLLLKNKKSFAALKKEIAKMVANPPLSKFGIQSEFIFIFDVKEFQKKIYTRNLYGYNANKTNKLTATVQKNEITKYPFLSKIRNEVTEK